MFEDIIATLDSMGVEYTEDYDNGSLSIAVGDIDKVQLIDIINAVNESGLPFTIDESSLIITGLEAPAEETPTEEPAEADIMNTAMNDALGL